MSIQAEIDRIVSFRDLSFDAVRDKGVAVPADAVIDDLPTYIASIPSGGVSGFEIEEGTYTPTADEATPVIPFARTHDTMPFFVAISDASRTSTSGSIGATTNTFYDLIYFNWKNLFNATQPRYVSASTTKRYGMVYRVYCASEVSTTGNTDLTVLDTSTGTSSGAYPRYWVTPAEFKPRGYESTVTIKFKKGKAYKWIAIWKTE